MGRQPQVGDTLGRYVLEEELGRGGMAVVYRALDPTLERTVAVKVLHGHLDDLEHARRFLREARAAAQLEHDSILKVHDYGGGDKQEGIAAYIVAELIRGPSLQAYIARRGALLPEVAAMVVLRLAEALSCAHEKGIIHRDVKPDNVMIAEGGRVVLTDFGIARVLEGDSVTRTGALLGSPAYMSPEQARGEPVDARSDLFALGTVLYKLCTGKLPFSAPDPLATVLRIIKGAYTPPLALNPRIGKALERVIIKLLAQKREDRYDSAATLAKALRELLADVGIDDPEAALAEYFESPGDYNRTLVGQVVTRSIERARVARERGEHATALAYCDRVLAFEPQNGDALELIETLSSSRGRRTPLVLGAIGIVLVGGIAAAFGLSRNSGSGHAGRRDGASAVTRGADGGSGSASARLAASKDAAGRGSARVFARADAATRSRDDAPRLVRTHVSPPRSGSARHRPPRHTARDRRRRRDAGLTKSPGGKRDASAASAQRLPDAATKAKPLKTQLRVRIGPWCKAFIDGRGVGSSPDGPWHDIAPGEHTVRCVQKRNGLSITRTVTVARGQRYDLRDTIMVGVSLALTAGDAVRVDRRLYRPGSTFRVPASRFEVAVLKQGRPIKRGWVTFTKRCVLTDSPKIGCKR